MAFKIGDEVICIDDNINNDLIKIHFPNWIKKDNKYTIRDTSHDLNGEQGVLLNEISNKPIYSNTLRGYFEPRFHNSRFRKVDEVPLQMEKAVFEELCLN